MRIIGLAGLKTSGKDSTYLAIKAALADQNVDRVGFADKLKVLAAKTLGYDGSNERLIDLMNECKEKWLFEAGEASDFDGQGFLSFSGRELLQRLGEFGRVEFGDEFWIDQVLPWHDMRLKYPGVDVLCVTDVRYSNEAFRILQLGGEVWEVRRPGLSSDGHVTEQPMPDHLVTVIIENDSNLEALDAAVAEALS